MLPKDIPAEEGANKDLWRKILTAIQNTGIRFTDTHIYIFNIQSIKKGKSPMNHKKAHYKIQVRSSMTGLICWCIQLTVLKTKQKKPNKQAKSKNRTTGSNVHETAWSTILVRCWFTHHSLVDSDNETVSATPVHQWMSFTSLSTDTLDEHSYGSFTWGKKRILIKKKSNLTRFLWLKSKFHVLNKIQKLFHLLTYRYSVWGVGVVERGMGFGGEHYCCLFHDSSQK